MPTRAVSLLSGHA